MKATKLVFAILLCSAAIGYAQNTNIDGTWLGTLDTGALKLRVAFNISGSDNSLTATMDSLDQGAKGIPVTSVTRSGSTLKMVMERLGGAFTGEISPDLESIQGTFSQGGGSIPLLLKRVRDARDLQPPARPQVPSKPYPYREEEVTIENRSANVKLAATLTIPQGQGPFPGVLLITGSGPQDRDESIMGHQPFLILADYLTRKGIAVLRADDRGTARSTGDFAAATTADFATDVEAGVVYLQSRSEVNKQKIGLIGHSEGGDIAPMVAARNHHVAFIVLMAGTGLPGDDVLAEQVRIIAAASGASEAQATAAATRQREILSIVKGERNDTFLARKLHESLAGKMPEAQIDMQIKSIMTPWFRYFIEYDPAIALGKVKCPVLALNGEKDTQVAAKENLSAIRKALAGAGNKNVEIVEFPGLNHLFQTAKTGLPAEYGTIEETMSPGVLDKIATWILAHDAIAPSVSSGAR